ncbi:MAG: hypothetical protein WBK55_04160 [Alphaproteobacteria bacterium]
MIFRGSRKAVYVALAALALCISIASSGMAASFLPIADSPCDPEYYDSLRSRAWLEAQREITQNQNLIVKPDSVLEYTCFDQFANILAGEAINMFSETPRWGVVLPFNSMDIALRNLVGGALDSYIAVNFPHTFRGGRSVDLDYVPGSISGMPGSAYDCTMMRDVWYESKCTDFIEDDENDGFFTFENYRDTDDKRVRPDPCPGIPGRWEDEINLATVNPFTPWEEDNQPTFFGLLEGCSNNTFQLETGVIVTRSKQEPLRYRERVCVPAGCRYVPSGFNNGSCQ